MAAAEEPEIWLVRGEGGDIIPMSLPLGEGIAARLRSGACVRVDSNGDPWTPPVDTPAAPPASLAEQMADKAFAEQENAAPQPMPKKSASKTAWVAYAASTKRITAVAAEDLTRDELVQRFG